jgi:hypothetical protein
MDELRGRCLCGGISFVITGPARDVINCHCERCRRFTGHFMAGSATTIDAITITGSESLRWYEPSPGVGYGFCGTCGSSLFWRTDTKPEHLSICAGTLDPPTGLRTTQAWWTDHASDYHERDLSLEEFGTE